MQSCIETRIAKLERPRGSCKVERRTATALQWGRDCIRINKESRTWWFSELILEAEREWIVGCASDGEEMQEKETEVQSKVEL